MKKVILVRHAKSSWKDSEQRDIDRPLNQRGKRDAPMMGARLATRGVRPGRMISSPAKRARRTAQAIAAELDHDASAIAIDDRIYHGGTRDLLDIMREQDDSLDCIMIFAHNPDVTEFANLLDRGFILNVPTCGVLEIDFDVARWEEIGDGTCVRLEFDYPKNTAT
jgi:phosphohistidine phosphatase